MRKEKIELELMNTIQYNRKGKSTQDIYDEYNTIRKQFKISSTEDYQKTINNVITSYKVFPEFSIYKRVQLVNGMKFRDKVQKSVGNVDNHYTEEVEILNLYKLASLTPEVAFASKKGRKYFELGIIFATQLDRSKQEELRMRKEEEKKINEFKKRYLKAYSSRKTKNYK